MSARNFIDFLRALRDSEDMLARYRRRNVAQLVFHARNDGFDFTVGDISDAMGPLEANVIMHKDGEPMNESSSLWRSMWGKTHLDYFVEDVVRRHTDSELESVTAGAAEEER
ncbi:MAG: hypothetical protein JO345_33465 [Streptosporangiaceae bacterium]|nr:hypothetical protein [Streptosporangiaceae bacterium]